MKLLVSDYDVQTLNENTNNEFLVKFCGPKDSPYEGVRLFFFLIRIISHF